ncbi:MAG: UpxY family transcription antiterminator [Bacteroidales bacterium]
MNINDKDNLRQWHVAYTAPRAEKKVSDRLSEQGINHYLPLKKTMKQWSDRRKWVEEPLFPSYIFVQVDRKEYFDAINTDGMVCYIRFEGKAAMVREQTMSDIRRIAEAGLMAEMVDEMPRPGTRYSINAGPLKGISGRVVRLKGKTHFVLEVEELGKFLVLPFSAS